MFLRRKHQTGVRLGVGAKVTAEYGRNRSWPPEVIAEPVNLEERDSLAELLKRFSEKYVDDPDVGIVFWSLGKVGEPTMVSFFRAALRQHLTRDPVTVYQILIALDNFEERVFRRSSSSITDTEENLQCAHAYLDRVEV